VMAEVKGISKEVAYVFAAAKLNFVWPQLDKVLPDSVTRPIIKKIWEEYDHMDNETKGPPSTYFLKRSQEEFNPLLNKVLKREEDFPTWNNLLSYALRNYIYWDTGARAAAQGIEQDSRFKLYPADRKIN